MSTSPTERTICLLTAGHLSSTPRLVREADALAAAGFRVHVVAGRSFPPADPLDASLLTGAAWQFHRFDHLRGPGALWRRLQQRIARRLVLRAPFAQVPTASLACHAGARAQARLAASLDADLYLGHQLAGLGMAALAAAQTGAHLGFDIEDYHDGETHAAMCDPALSRAARILQANLLPRCRHLTAAAPLIARRYAQDYGVEPVVVHNVYSLKDAPPAPIEPAPISADAPAILYWFSQTVGPGRGLEAMLALMSRLQTPAVLHLRGNCSDGYAAELTRLANTLGVRQPVLLPSAAPGELVRLAASAHLGLSLEERTPPNRNLCLPNKIFAYLLAGLPQLLSATDAHIALASELGEASLVIDFDHPETAAQAVDAALSNPSLQSRGRAAAWRLGRERFNLEHEQDLIVRPIRRLLR